MKQMSSYSNKTAPRRSVAQLLWLLASVLLLQCYGPIHKVSHFAISGTVGHWVSAEAEPPASTGKAPAWHDCAIFDAVLSSAGPAGNSLPPLQVHAGKPPLVALALPSAVSFGSFYLPQIRAPPTPV